MKKSDYAALSFAQQKCLISWATIKECLLVMVFVQFNANKAKAVVEVWAKLRFVKFEVFGNLADRLTEIAMGNAGEI